MTESEVITIRERTTEELEKENLFLVDYVHAINAVSAYDSKWTGRGPAALLAFVFMGKAIDRNDAPYNEFEYKLLVRFMDKLPAHLKELCDLEFKRMEQEYFIIKEDEDRKKILRERNLHPIVKEDVRPLRMR